MYKTNQPIELFGLKTNEVALAGQGITAVFRNVNVQQLSKKFDIPQHPDFTMLPLFRGVRTIKTEPATSDSVTFYHNLNLSEMKGKKPMVLLGCTYEADREEMEKMLQNKKKYRNITSGIFLFNCCLVAVFLAFPASKHFAVG